MVIRPTPAQGRRGAAGHSPHVTYWMPASLQPAAYLPVQISSTDQNSSLTMVSLMFSFVTATGVEQNRRNLLHPVVDLVVRSRRSSPVASATPSSAAASASALIAL